MQLFERCQSQVKVNKKFRFKNKLVGLDSTIICLCISLFDYANFRRTRGAIKLHLLLDHDGYLPSFAVITEGKVADVKVASEFHFAPGTIVVDDRGYKGYDLFGRRRAQGVYFVTRMKEYAVYEVVGERRVSQNRHVLKDELIELKGLKAIEKCPYPLRRIEAYDSETDKVLVFLTNQLELRATTIAAVYKDRWQMEIFFKALKQNLKIKIFVGTRANAIKIQIWTALIAMLILRFLQLRSQFHWSLSNLVTLLRMNLFTHRDLWAWLNKPFDVLLIPYEPEQLRLRFA
jgi:IS4 transposase